MLLLRLGVVEGVLDGWGRVVGTSVRAEVDVLDEGLPVGSEDAAVVEFSGVSGISRTAMSQVDTSS